MFYMNWKRGPICSLLHIGLDSQSATREGRKGGHLFASLYGRSPVRENKWGQGERLNMMLIFISQEIALKTRWWRRRSRSDDVLHELNFCDPPSTWVALLVCNLWGKERRQFVCESVWTKSSQREQMEPGRAIKYNVNIYLPGNRA